MASIIRIFRKYWSYLFPYRQLYRVSFTSSTVIQERQRTLRNIASPSPFINYLNEMRLTSLNDTNRDNMPIRESEKFRKFAFHLWCNLSETRKQKYRELAANWQRTRIQHHREDKSTLHLPNDTLESIFGPMSETVTKPKKRNSFRPRTRTGVTTRSRSRSAAEPTRRQTRSRSAARNQGSKRITPVEAPKERVRRKRTIVAIEPRSSELLENLQMESSEVETSGTEEPRAETNDLTNHRTAKRKRRN